MKHSFVRTRFIKKSPRQHWLQNRMQGRIILDIGFVGQDGSLHKSLRSMHPQALWIGLDRNLEGALSLQLPGTLVGDGFTLPFASASIDSVVLAEVAEHLYDIHPIIQEISRVLQVGGRLFLTTPNPYNLLLWPKFWLFAKRPIQRSNYRRFLGAPDHCIFWEPLSLTNLLYDHRLVVEEMTTKNLDIPLLRRYWSGARLLGWDFWPFNRLGFYTCLIARRVP